jgi:hypothetical protein
MQAICCSGGRLSALCIHSCQKKVRLADYLRQPHVEIRHRSRTNAGKRRSKPCWARVCGVSEGSAGRVAPEQVGVLRWKKDVHGRRCRQTCGDAASTLPLSGRDCAPVDVPDDQCSMRKIACNRRSAREKYQIARPPSTGYMQHKRARDQTSAEKLIALTAQGGGSSAKIRNGAIWLRVAGSGRKMLRVAPGRGKTSRAPDPWCTTFITLVLRAPDVTSG